MNTTKQPLLIWSSILVTLQMVTGGAALGDFIGERTAGLCILIVAALQAGTAFYIRGLVTPNISVAATIDDHGNYRASDANPEAAAGTRVDIAPVDD